MRAPATDQAASGHALVVRELSAGYRGVPVVRGLNMEVGPGEGVALLGPNGAGTTTTVETIGGTPAYQLAGRGLALVPEGRALFPGLTVREHLRLAGGRGARGGRDGRDGRGGQSRRAGSREDELLEMLPELRKCLGRKAGLLSGGEQQMLAV